MRGDPTIPNTSNLTLSIDDTIYDAIKNKAQKENQSINAVINQVFSKHLQFHRYLEEQHHVILPLEMFVSVVDLVGEKEILNTLTIHASEIIPSLFAHHNIPYTLENLIEYFLKGPMILGGAYSLIDIIQNETKTTITLEHKKGQLWSKVLGKGLCNIIQNYFGYECDYETKHYKTIIRIEK